MNSSSAGSSKALEETAAANKGKRRILVIRHGERIDFTFNKGGENWVRRAFDPATGRYKRFSINMPRSVPTRAGGYQAFQQDSPLTEMGYLQAKLTGRALKDAGVRPTHVYVSPALRCVQTAVGLLKGMNNATGLKLNIEPGLFEWGAWFKPQLPLWMSAEELIAAGYPINPAYQPVTASFATSESLNDYYNRSHTTVRKIMERHPADVCVLLIAHGASLETCSRQLTGGSPRVQNDFYLLLHQTSYLAVAQLGFDPRLPTGWELLESPVLPLQHTANQGYDPAILSKPIAPSSH